MFRSLPRQKADRHGLGLFGAGIFDKQNTSEAIDMQKNKNYRFRQRQTKNKSFASLAILHMDRTLPK